MKKGTILLNANEVATPIGNKSVKGKEMSKLHVLKDASIVLEDEKIICVNSTDYIKKNFNLSDYEIVDCRGKCILPGFVDSHTHFIFGGYRANEFDMRLKGLSYMEIMKAGGGIQSTVEDTKKSSYDELFSLGKKRLEEMMSFGITTVEGKSGYGLDFETEIKQLKVMKDLNQKCDIDIVSTYLGAHAVPPLYKGKVNDYINFIIKKVLPYVKENNLSSICDVFCEKGVFSIEESKLLLEEAKKLGFKVKLHADEIVCLGGTELGVDLNALSVDHLLHTSNLGIEKLSKGDTVATILPCTAFSLKEDYARGREMIDKGCAVALASDFNPGSCFTNYIPLIFALGIFNTDLSVEECITGMTLNGAAALGLAHKIGSIEEGKFGDLVILKYPSYKFIPYNICVNTVEHVVKRGKFIF